MQRLKPTPKVFDRYVVIFHCVDHKNLFRLYFSQGHCDYPLTNGGISQAELAGKYLRNVSWDYVISSDLMRCRKTLEIIRNQSMVDCNHVKDNYDEIIREVNFGIRENLPKNTSVEEARKILSVARGVPLDQILDSAESEDDVRIRQQKFISILYDSLPAVSKSKLTGNPTKILCVTHGGYIKRFLTNFGSKSVNEVPNCSITTVVISGCAIDDNVSKFECKALDTCHVDHLLALPRPDVFDDVAHNLLEKELEYRWPIWDSCSY